jgi:hypothetical protein
MKSCGRSILPFRDSQSIVKADESTVVRLLAPWPMLYSGSIRQGRFTLIEHFIGRRIQRLQG